MKRKALPAQEYLHECFDYREEGYLIWKARPNHHFKHLRGRHDFKGLIAGSINAHNRTVIAINGQKFYSHCIIWTMFNGELLENMDVDHKDGNTLNNRIENLRLATGSQNNWNAQKPSHNTSGIKGVWWSLKKEKWIAEFKAKGVKYYVGEFSDKEVAEKELKLKRELVCKEFANHGVHKYES